MASLRGKHPSGGRTAAQSVTENIVGKLAAGSPGSVVRLMSQTLNSIDLDNCPVGDETFLLALVQGYLFGAGLNPVAKDHGSPGTSDSKVEVEAGGRL